MRMPLCNQSSIAATDPYLILDLIIPHLVSACHLCFVLAGVAANVI
jgi:hypothetical protein